MAERRYLKAARALKGLSLEDVFEKTGIPTSTMHSYEKGTRNIPAEKQEILSKVLGVPMKQFRKGA